jgi:putative ABC transport system substrate-binding protein
LPAAIARTPQGLDVAFDVLRRQRPQALFVHSDVLFFVQRSRVINLAAQARLPASYSFTEDVEAGGLMAYAVQFRDLYERTPVFIDKILKGANPAEMPIEQPTRFGLWLNLRTANALGLVLPRTLLLLAERIVD